MTKSGLDEFREVVTDFRSIGAYIMGGAAGAPLALALTKFGPPWPAGVPVLTSLTEFLVLIFVFHFWFEKTSVQINRRMLMALLFLIVSFFLYLFLLDTYTFTQPYTGQTEAKGFCLRKEMITLVQESGSDLEALKGAEYNPEIIWEPWSITSVRLTLLTVWLAFFASLSVFVGSFVISQRRRRGVG